MTPNIADADDFLGLGAFAAAGQGIAPAREPQSIDLLTEADDIPREVAQARVNREANRYLFFPGDVLTPQQKRERPDLRIGGEYYGQQYKTLYRSKGLVRRCQITPMVKAYDDLNDDQIGDSPLTVEIRSLSSGVPLNRVRVYPGDEITGILQGERNNTSKGVVELTDLIGVELNVFGESKLQEFIFPEWEQIKLGVAVLPAKLSELQKQIDARLQATSDDTIRNIIRQMLSACEIYRTWGIRYLKISSDLVKLQFNNGFSHTHSELAEMLFEQLEVTPVDLLRDARNAPAVTVTDTVSDSDIRATMAQIAQVQQQMAELLGRSQAAQAQTETRTATAPAEIEAVCAGLNAKGEPCKGKVTKTIDGKTYCPSHPKETDGESGN
jgi:hypothetical protein